MYARPSRLSRSGEIDLLLLSIPLSFATATRLCLRLDVEIVDDLFGHCEDSDRIVALFDSLSVLDGQREITEDSGDLGCKVAESNWLTLSRLTREYVRQITGHG